MDLEQFIYKLISGIENATKKINKTYKKDEELSKSDINFDLFIDIKDGKIVVQNYKMIKETKSNLNKIKFSIKYNQKQPDISSILERIEREQDPLVKE